ncbi:MAG: cytochrome C oxidase subunit IV family protein [Anaerolineales bacterium]|nr:cytochrome C oxidase subunit IV family protein [Anaerolineales bacterium]MCB8951115.1 cytochrome C oxidase subunit IV family protein [Ardenticatenales bacterium]
MELKKVAYRQGIYVLIALAALTILEFVVSSATDGSASLLFIIALLKTGLIVNYFMHIYRLWREESH